MADTKLDIETMQYERVRETSFTENIASTRRGSNSTNKVAIYFAGHINRFNQMVNTSTVDGIKSGNEDVTSQFNLGIGDALVELNMIPGPIDPIEELEVSTYGLERE